MLNWYFYKSNISRCVVLMMLASPAQAYVGPGLGAGTIGVVLGILTSIVLIFLAILWYPLKRLFKKTDKEKQGKERQDKEQQEAPDSSEDPS